MCHLMSSLTLGFRQYITVRECRNRATMAECLHTRCGHLSGPFSQATARMLCVESCHYRHDLMLEFRVCLSVAETNADSCLPSYYHLLAAHGKHSLVMGDDDLQHDIREPKCRLLAICVAWWTQSSHKPTNQVSGVRNICTWKWEINCCFLP